MDTLLDLDRLVFHFVNDTLHTPWLDAIVPYLRNKYFWIPLYVAVTALAVRTFGARRAGWWLLFLGLTVTATDTISSRAVKKNVQRLRPCKSPELAAEVNLLVSCGSGYSFTSSHATNHFGVAVYWILTLGSVYRRWRWVMLLWAASVAFAQVYVGVHYPIDVLAGALLGTALGWGVHWLYRRLLPRLAVPQKATA